MATAQTLTASIHLPDLQPICFQGDYSDLRGAPRALSDLRCDLIDKGTLNKIAATGSYFDLRDRPTSLSRLFSSFDLVDRGYLAPLSVTGNWSDLIDRPSFLSQFTNDLGIKQVAYSGCWGDLAQRKEGMRDELTHVAHPLTVEGGSLTVTSPSSQGAVTLSATDATDATGTVITEAKVQVPANGKVHIGDVVTVDDDGVHLKTGGVTFPDGSSFDGSFTSLSDRPSFDRMPNLTVEDPDRAQVSLHQDPRFGPASLSYINQEVSLSANHRTYLRAEGDTGFVAIGQRAPTAKLHVQDGDAVVDGALDIGQEGIYHQGTARHTIIQPGDDCVKLYGPSQVQPTLVLDDEGRVGVNTQNPECALDVRGGLQVQGICTLPGIEASSERIAVTAPITVTVGGNSQTGIVITSDGITHARDGPIHLGTSVCVSNETISLNADAHVEGDATFSGYTRMIGELCTDGQLTARGPTELHGTLAALRDVTVEGTLTCKGKAGVDELVAHSRISSPTIFSTRSTSTTQITETLECSSITSSTGCLEYLQSTVLDAKTLAADQICTKGGLTTETLKARTADLASVICQEMNVDGMLHATDLSVRDTLSCPTINASRLTLSDTLTTQSLTTGSLTTGDCTATGTLACKTLFVESAQSVAGELSTGALHSSRVATNEISLMHRFGIQVGPVTKTNDDSYRIGVYTNQGDGSTLQAFLGNTPQQHELRIGQSTCDLIGTERAPGDLLMLDLAAGSISLPQPYSHTVLECTRPFVHSESGRTVVDFEDEICLRSNGREVLRIDRQGQLWINEKPITTLLSTTEN